MSIFDTVRTTATDLGFLLIIIVIGLFFVGIVGAAYYFWKKKKAYGKIKVLIWKTHKTLDKKEIPVIVGWDSGIVRKDKKLKKWAFHLRKNNLDLGEEEGAVFDEIKDLDIPTIPHEAGGQVAFIEKIGPRKFAFSKPFTFEGNVKVLVSSADVAEAIRAYDINARYFGDDKMKWAGPIAFAVFAVLIIVLISILLQKFDVVKESMEIALEIAKHNKAAVVVSGIA